MKKILIVPPTRPWYMEAHYEYLIRYLSDEFFIEIADVPYPPYENFLDRYPETYPFQRNPDEYDLIVPMLATHWVIVERDKYAHKVGIVMYEPGEGRHQDVKVVGCTTPVVEKDCTVPHHSLRFGIDTDLFKPLRFQRQDNKLHVGVIGTLTNPRRQIKEIESLFDMPRVKFDFYPSSWVNNGDIERSGGKKYLENVVTGDKYWTGLPNIYNRMDVLLRIDNSYGYSFPTLEAAACGVPVITTYQGIDHHITGAGGGILLLPDAPNGPRWPFYEEQQLIDKVRKAIEFMRDNPDERKIMGVMARDEVVQNWQWKNHIENWRQFFRDGTNTRAN